MSPIKLTLIYCGVAVIDMQIEGEAIVNIEVYYVCSISLLYFRKASPIAFYGKP